MPSEGHSSLSFRTKRGICICKNAKRSPSCTKRDRSSEGHGFYRVHSFIKAKLQPCHNSSFVIPNEERNLHLQERERSPSRTKRNRSPEGQGFYRVHSFIEDKISAMPQPKFVCHSERREESAVVRTRSVLHRAKRDRVAEGHSFLEETGFRKGTASAVP
jgi:hypothetical protein